MGTTYTQLSITERRKIERWRHAKVPVNEVARVLKRCRSTIFRELKRNHFSDECMPKCDGYYGATAHLMQADRRRGTVNSSNIQNFVSVSLNGSKMAGRLSKSATG